MLAIREFASHVHKRTAAIIRIRCSFDKISHALYKRLRRLIGMLRDTAFDPLPEACVHARQVRHDQIVLRRKLPVHAHLVHTRAFDDRVYADRPNTIAIKQLLGGVERLFLRGGAVHVPADGFFTGDSVFIRYTYHGMSFTSEGILDMLPSSH